MKKMVMTILFLTVFFKLFAPGYISGTILHVDKIVVFDPVLWAFQKVESDFRTSVVNSLGYTGILQIGPEMVGEANRINSLTGNPERYTFPASALDSLESVKIWYVVQNWHNSGYDVKRCAKIWNPKASKNYLKKIRKNMTKVIDY